MATRRWTEAEARGVIAEWKQSGKSGRAFAEEQSIEVQRLYWWKKKLGSKLARSASAAASFLPVRIADAASDSLTVVLRGGQLVKLARGFDEELFARVVAVLEGA
jgi:hypothetical protein